MDYYKIIIKEKGNKTVVDTRKNDLCRCCEFRGDLDKCKSINCPYRETWYPLEQQKRMITMDIEQIIERLDAIEAKLGIVRDERFKIMECNEVLDTKTGLTWIRHLPNDAMIWDKAMDCYKNNALWRIPTIQELLTLMDYTVCCSDKRLALPNDHPFINVQQSNYWSATPYIYDTNMAWYINISYGHISSFSKSDRLYVWPIKKGGKNL